MIQDEQDHRTDLGMNRITGPDDAHLGGVAGQERRDGVSPHRERAHTQSGRARCTSTSSQRVRTSQPCSELPHIPCTPGTAQNIGYIFPPLAPSVTYFPHSPVNSLDVEWHRQQRCGTGAQSLHGKHQLQSTQQHNTKVDGKQR